jgi:DNA-binding transcriptional LysR family regulator
MELDWLEDFVALADSGSFSRSAKKRYVSQPAFSRRIMALEAWLETELFDRGTIPVTLTPAGGRFRQTVPALLDRLYAARDEARGEHRLPRESVRFAAPQMLALRYFPDWLDGLHAQFGWFASKLAALDTSEALKRLSSESCDILLVYHQHSLSFELDAERFQSLTLDREFLRPYSCCDAHGLPAFTVPGASPIPYLSYSPGAFLGRIVDAILRKHEQERESQNGAVLEYRFESDLVDALKEMAVRRHGMAWLPERTAQPEVAAGRLAVAGDAPWSAELEIRVYRSVENSNPTVGRLWRYLERRASGA